MSDYLTIAALVADMITKCLSTRNATHEIRWLSMEHGEVANR